MSSGVISGAIRWDAWYEATQNDVPDQAQQCLSLNEYQSRAPWFAQRGNNVLRAVGVQANMDAEIGYASGAGLKYWAFNEYSVGNPLRNGWNLYQSSSLKSGMKWCWISQLNYLGTTSNFATQVTNYIANFKDPQYQTVLGGRPLWFLSWSTANFNGSWGGSYSNLAAMITALRAAASTAGVGNPYIVVMDSSTNAPVEASAIGADAISYYNVSNYGTYPALVSRNEVNWTTYAAAAGALGFIPTAVCGWDRRPFYARPQSWYNPGASPYVNMFLYTADGVVSQVAQHIQDCVTWVLGHSTADPAAAMLIYAWNEHVECGGNCLNPTIGNPPPSTLLSALSAFLP